MFLFSAQPCGRANTAHTNYTVVATYSALVVGNCSCAISSQHHLGHPVCPRVTDFVLCHCPPAEIRTQVLTPHPTRYGQGSTFFLFIAALTCHQLNSSDLSLGRKHTFTNNYDGLVMEPCGSPLPLKTNLIYFQHLMRSQASQLNIE